MRPGRYEDPCSAQLTQTAFVGGQLVNLINKFVYKLSHFGDIKILEMIRPSISRYIGCKDI